MKTMKPVYYTVMNNFLSCAPSKFIETDQRERERGVFPFVTLKMEYPFNVSDLDYIKVNPNMFCVNLWGMNPKPETPYRVSFQKKDYDYGCLSKGRPSNGIIVGFHLDKVDHLSCRIDVHQINDNGKFNFIFYIVEGKYVNISKYKINNEFDMSLENSYHYGISTIAYDILVKFTKALIASHRLTYNDPEWNYFV
ncbi:hypothetical protein phiOC_p024 [Ochrobactrum phage vB_OspM_OC]|nr:hypothetical protein phiOC_p024 [Ochrobactrum phage vB_OspM_OC]